MDPFVESEMTFGPYADGHCFRVEQSATYLAIQEGVQMAEFLLLRTQDEGPPSIWIVEAKMSSPRTETQPNFNDFIGEIRDKLANALAVGVTSILQRHPAAATELPDSFKNLDLASVGFRLVLSLSTVTRSHGCRHYRTPCAEHCTPPLRRGPWGQMLSSLSTMRRRSISGLSQRRSLPKRGTVCLP